MKITDIAFFAYAVSDMSKARAFYEGVLNLRPYSDPGVRPNPNWVEYELGSATLGVGCAPGFFDPSTKGASAALEVEDFDAALLYMQAKGVPFVMGPLDGPSCRMVVIADPDGNRITIHKKKRQ